MATQPKKKAVKRASQPKRKPRRKATSPSGRQSGTGAFGKFFLPGAISACILICLGVLLFFGYRTVTASNFFEVREVAVTGTTRASKQDIERIVRGETEKLGAWNADLPDIRQKIEKLPYIKTAAVSRSLPNGMRVIITERVPIAVVHLSAGDYYVDNEAEILAPIDKNDPPQDLMMIRGWDEAKSERAAKDNSARIKMFQKMTSDWGEFGLGKKVKEVNLSDLLEPKAVVEDSGSQIPVTLSREEFAKSLKSAIEAVAGKGERIKSVNSSGVYPVIEYIGNN